MDPELVRKANTKIGELQQAEIQNMKDLGLVNDEEDFEPPRGSILGWSSSDSVELTGVLYILLCLILVNGRSINERTRSTSILLLCSTHPLFSDSTIEGPVEEFPSSFDDKIHPSSRIRSQGDLPGGLLGCPYQTELP